MNMKLRVEGQELTAILFDNDTAHDFRKLLPLTLVASDLMTREKYAHLPRPLCATAQASRSFEVGDIAYWPPGEDIAVFYRDDGKSIPEPGIIKIGRIDAGIEVFGVAGSLTMIIECEDS